MKLREIAETDVAVVMTLLCEGFPRRSQGYWQNALDILRARPRVEPVPQFGYLLDVDGATEGVLLTIGGGRNGAPLCNLSSWYVRPAARAASVLFLQRALRLQGVTCTDISPAKAILPLNEKLGFLPYTGGSLLIGPGAALRRGHGRVGRLGPAELAGLDPALGERLRAHLGYGCEGVVLSREGGPPAPLLYRRVRVKRAIPAARVVFGDLDRIVEATGALMRHLLGRGIVALLTDLPATPPGALPGRVLPGYGVRYVKGPAAPPVGDLLDTEAALFGP